MRLLVYGGRDFRGRRDLFEALDWLDLNRVIDVVIEGEASGADRLSRIWADDHEVPVHPFPADWDDIECEGAVVRRRKDGKLYNAAAGGWRNQTMLTEGEPSHGLQCPGGSGTDDMRRRLDRAAVPVIELYDLLDRISDLLEYKRNEQKANGDQRAGAVVKGDGSARREQVARRVHRV